MAEVPKDFLDKYIEIEELIRLDFVVDSFKPKDTPVDFIVKIILGHTDFGLYTTLKLLIRGLYSDEKKTLDEVEEYIRIDIKKEIGIMKVHQVDFHAALKYHSRIKQN